MTLRHYLNCSPQFFRGVMLQFNLPQHDRLVMWIVCSPLLCLVRAKNIWLENLCSWSLKSVFIYLSGMKKLPAVNKGCCGHQVINHCSHPSLCMVRQFEIQKSRILALDTEGAYQRNNFNNVETLEKAIVLHLFWTEGLTSFCTSRGVLSSLLQKVTMPDSPWKLIKEDGK